MRPIHDSQVSSVVQLQVSHTCQTWTKDFELPMLHGIEVGLVLHVNESFLLLYRQLFVKYHSTWFVSKTSSQGLRPTSNFKRPVANHYCVSNKSIVLQCSCEH